MQRAVLLAMAATLVACTNYTNTWISLRNDTGQPISLDSTSGLANVAPGEIKRDLGGWVWREDRPSNFSIITPTVTWHYTNYQDAAIRGMREFRHQRRFDGNHIYAAIDAHGRIWVLEQKGSVAVRGPQPTGFPIAPSSHTRTPPKA
jgi:hypothetical protein